MDWTDRVLAVAALVVAGGVILGAGWRVYRMLHRVDQALGVDKEGRTLSERMSRVEYQLWPNAGQSLKDQVGRVERQVTESTAEIRVVREMLSTLIDKRP